MQSRNLAARAGRWSAQHRKTAILGWILFVVLATVLGGKVGQNELDESAAGSGESKRGDMIVKAAGFPDQAGEQVLVQGKGSGILRSPPPCGTSWAASQRIRGVTEIESPLTRDRVDTVSKDGRSVVVNFKLPGTDEQADAARRPSRSPPWPPSQAAHPGVRVEQFGDASAAKEIAAQDAKDGKKAEAISYGLLLIILLVAFGALVAAGVPLVLGATAVAATIGLLGPVSQLYALPADVAELVVDHRPRGRRRLRDVLLAPHDGGARPRPLGRGRGGDRRRHLGPRGADLGPDRDDRDGRAAVRRQPDLHRLRHRHDARRRRRACSAR